MSTQREVLQQALEQVQVFKRCWWLVPAFGNKVNKATREAITNAHSPIFELEHALRAALAEHTPSGDAEDAARYRWLALGAHKSAAYERYGEGAYWNISLYVDDGRLDLDAVIDAARKEGK